MAKHSISLTDEAEQKLAALLKEKGGNVSSVISEVLASCSEDGSATPDSKPDGASTPAPPSPTTSPQAPPSAPAPSTASDPRVDALIARVQNLEQQVASRDANINLALKRIDDLDLRLSRLWNEVHDR